MGQFTIWNHSITTTYEIQTITPEDAGTFFNKVRISNFDEEKDIYVSFNSDSGDLRLIPGNTYEDFDGYAITAINIHAATSGAAGAIVHVLVGI